MTAIHIKKYLFVYIFTILLIFQLKAENNAPSLTLSKIQPSWVAVLGGNALCAPVKTSYGFVVVSEGKLVSAFTESGKVLWQRSFQRLMKPFITVGLSDMLYVVSGKGTLTMLNPGGMIIWSQDTGFAINNTPLAGRDGRVFVNGGNKLECYGIKGTLRWSIQTDSQDSSVPPVSLNDGSLLVFLSRTENGKSIASRISPFGKVIENITFSARVKQAVSCTDGVLLTFTDGSAGFCSVKDSSVDSRWVIPTGSGILLSPTVACPQSFSSAGAVVLFTGDPARVLTIKTSDGSVISSYNSSIINTAALAYSGVIYPQSVVSADSNNALLLRSDGSTAWTAQFNFGSLKKWNYVFYTDTGYLAFCGTNWVIEAYRMEQTVGKQASLYQEMSASSYDSFYAKTTAESSNLLGRAISPEESKMMEQAFESGNIGDNESRWLPLLENEMTLLSESWQNTPKDHYSEKPYFCTNITYAEEVLSLAGKSETTLFFSKINNLLQTVTDPTFLLFLVKTAGDIAYDPNQSMLFSLNTIVHNASPSDVTLLTCVCDSVYEICKYMGRPAFFSYGEEILSTLLFPQYDKKIRDYARTTLTNIAKLKL